MNLTRTYVVPVAPVEVLARLSGVVDPETFFSKWESGNHRHYGWIGSNTFEIKLRSEWHNSYKPVLYGKVDTAPGGSIVRVRVGMDGFTRVFMKAWLIGTAAFQVLVLLAALQPEEKEFKGRVLPAPTGMMLGGLVLYRLGKALSRSAAERLPAFADQQWGTPMSEEPPKSAN